MKPQPICLRYFSGGIEIVSVEWWERFLLRQEINLQKINLTRTGSNGVTSQVRGNGTCHELVEQEANRRPSAV
jgi:hypothetical protein